MKKKGLHKPTKAKITCPPHGKNISLLVWEIGENQKYKPDSNLWVLKKLKGGKKIS